MLADVGDHTDADPNKLLEYTTWDLPFIASDFPRWRELFDCEIGIWLEPENPSLLAENIQQLIDHPQQLKQMAEATAEANCTVSWEVESQKMLAIYQQILSK